MFKKRLNGGVMYGFVWLLSAVFLSCSEKELDVTGGKEITTSVTVEVPEVFRTRAVPAVYPTDVKNYLGESGYPSIGNMDLNTHPLTFTVGVYVEKTVDGNPVYTLVDKQSKSKVADDKADFNFRLMKGQSYRIVAYADFSDNKQENLDNISIAPALNDELKDAFFVSEKFTAKDNLTVVLKRPFGKLRLIAHDFSTFAAGEVLEIETIKVTYGETATALATNSFNAITGEFNTEDVTREFTASPVVYAKEYEGDTPYAAVFTMYLPANFGTEDTSGDYLPVESGTPVPQSWMYPFDIEVTYKNESGEPTTIKRSFDIDIPVKRNWLTTIDAANFWTDNSNITVSIDHRFEGFIDNTVETVTVKTANELQEAIDKICNDAESGTWNTGKIVLGDDINADENTKIASAGGFVIDTKKAVHIYLDLNGHTISTSGSSIPKYNSTTVWGEGASVGGVFGIRNWNNILHIEDSSKEATGAIKHTGEAGANFYPLIYCSWGGQAVISAGTYISNSDGPVVYVYEMEQHHYVVLNQAYSEAFKNETPLESGGYNEPNETQKSYIDKRTKQLSSKATINGGWFQNAQPGTTAEDKKVNINSYNPREKQWNDYKDKLVSKYGQWANWGEYKKCTFGYVYLNGGSYVEFNPATGDNVSYNRPNKWVDDNHTVLIETVNGATVYTVIPNESPEYY